MIGVIAILSLLIIITYLVFPITVIALAKISTKKRLIEEQPFNSRVFIIMAVHNEAAVIADKLNSIAALNYPSENIICIIGTDNCTDDTENLINSYSNRLNINLFSFQIRKGKPAIVNHLVEKINNTYNLSPTDLFLMTDANVAFHPDFLKEMNQSFAHPKVGIVDGLVINPTQKNGSGESESVYVALETRIKMAESKLWKCSMGPFGGAFVMRANLYQPVPSNFLVDDFFLAFQILKGNYQSLVNEKAICYEEVSGSLKEEFRRKVRISSGNFQNAFYFLPHYLQFWKKHNLIFILHKLLRWLTPIITVIIVLLLAILATHYAIALKILLIMISLLVGCPLVNYLLNQLNLNLKPLQGVSYLIIMNLALLIGFVKYLKGIQSNVWEPTKRTISTQ
jgi:cellulose synthase/poly-beta-1,6-N-acetylglucosamine synthase-like glycosyltransferase